MDCYSSGQRKGEDEKSFQEKSRQEKDLQEKDARRPAMIPVPKPVEPDEFDGDVRQPGRKWIADGANGRPPSYWRKALPDLKSAFTNRCGYSAMLDRCGTVDQFVAQSHDPSLLYEWGNLRYASGWINSSKQDAEGVLDPHEVGEGWFEITLPSLQLVATDRVP